LRLSRRLHNTDTSLDMGERCEQYKIMPLLHLNYADCGMKIAPLVASPSNPWWSGNNGGSELCGGDQLLAIRTTLTYSPIISAIKVRENSQPRGYGEEAWLYHLLRPATREGIAGGSRKAF